MRRCDIPLILTSIEIARLLGISRQAVSQTAIRQKWEFEAKRGRGGGKYWLIESMPLDTREKVLNAWLAANKNKDTRTPEEIKEAEDRKEYLADVFRRKPEKARNRAEKRNRIMKEFIALVDDGMPIGKAIELVARNNDINPANVRNWYYGTDKKKGVRQVARDEWLFALMDNYAGRQVKAEWTEKAEEYFRSLYLVNKCPNLSDCYRRMKESAPANNWIVPSERTIRRRMTEVPSVLADWLRGKDRDFRNAMPPQKRDCTHFASGEAINGDGLHLDFWTEFEDGEIVEQPVVWCWEDLRSKKIVSRRLGKSENTDIIRMSLYDLFGLFTPRKLWVDNTRAAANKLLMGTTEGRHRFKNMSYDVPGLLQKAEIECHFTNPDHEMSSPGAKPIERVWRDYHKMIKNNPRLAGYGTKKRPVPVALLLEVIDEEINRYNAQTGRRGHGMNGKSHNQVFEENFDKQQQVVISPFDRDLFLLNREIVIVQPNGRIAINAGQGEGKNTYWSEISSQCAKQKVAVYYDPENLTKDLQICKLDGAYIGKAQYEPSVAFDSKEEGKVYAKTRKTRLKALKAAALAERKMTQLEAQQYTSKVEATATPEPERKVTRFGDAEMNRMISDLEKPSQEEQEMLRQNLARRISEMGTARASY